MTRSMKTVRPGRSTCIHVETPLGIVNIYTDLHDTEGRRVVTVEMIPSQMAGEKKVVRRGFRLVELKEVCS